MEVLCRNETDKVCYIAPYIVEKSFFSTSVKRGEVEVLLPKATVAVKCAAPAVFCATAHLDNAPVAALPALTTWPARANAVQKPLVLVMGKGGLTFCVEYSLELFNEGKFDVFCRAYTPDNVACSPVLPVELHCGAELVCRVASVFESVRLVASRRQELVGEMFVASREVQVTTIKTMDSEVLHMVGFGERMSLTSAASLLSAPSKHPAGKQMVEERTRQIDLASRGALFRANRESTGFALASSGGGLRAFLYLLGVLKGLDESGALDMFDALSGTSGSTWALLRLLALGKPGLNLSEPLLKALQEGLCREFDLRLSPLLQAQFELESPSGPDSLRGWALKLANTVFVDVPPEVQSATLAELAEKQQSLPLILVNAIETHVHVQAHCHGQVVMSPYETAFIQNGLHSQTKTISASSTVCFGTGIPPCLSTIAATCGAVMSLTETDIINHTIGGSWLGKVGMAGMAWAAKGTIAQGAVDSLVQPHLVTPSEAHFTEPCTRVSGRLCSGLHLALPQQEPRRGFSCESDSDGYLRDAGIYVNVPLLSLVRLGKKKIVVNDVSAAEIGSEFVNALQDLQSFGVKIQGVGDLSSTSERRRLLSSIQETLVVKQSSFVKVGGDDLCFYLFAPYYKDGYTAMANRTLDLCMIKKQSTLLYERGRKEGAEIARLLKK